VPLPVAPIKPVLTFIDHNNASYLSAKSHLIKGATTPSMENSVCNDDFETTSRYGFDWLLLNPPYCCFHNDNVLCTNAPVDNRSVIQTEDDRISFSNNGSKTSLASNAAA
jgi:hypothetical protein